MLAAVMARSAEVIRQWQVLRAIDAARNGVPIPKLASAYGVHQRTIRRDIQALSKAGFPLYDDNVAGTIVWKLSAKPFRGLEETGLSVTELCALYFSRSILETLAGAPFRDETARAFEKLERALPVASRRFLDRYPQMLKAKATGRKKQDEKKVREFIARAVDASLERRRVLMQYDSMASRRTKEYKVDPLRLAYADGGVYLIAWVEEYKQVRTFAVERIRTLAVLDEHFEPRELTTEPFAHSLGVHSGEADPVQVEFDARVAEYVKGREWHRSQVVDERPDGSLLMTLTVCDDRPLRSWIHSFGPLARVVSPATLAQEIFEEIDEARDRYMPRLTFDVPRAAARPSEGPAAAAKARNRRLPLKTRKWRVS
jgi:predicted DNA-binding transcriptional regulator YafY